MKVHEARLLLRRDYSSICPDLSKFFRNVLALGPALQSDFENMYRLLGSAVSKVYLGLFHRVHFPVALDPPALCMWSHEKSEQDSHGDKRRQQPIQE